MRWVQTACAGKGRIVESHWLGSSRLQAKLHFPSRWFENSRVTVKLQPRALPLRWLLSCWRRQKETLTFEADLGGSPSFHLEVVRHRWSAHNRQHVTPRRTRMGCLPPQPDHSHHAHPLEAGSQRRTQRAHVGPAPGNCAGPLPSRVAAVLSHRSPGGVIRPRGSRRLCHHPARDRRRSLSPPAVGFLHLFFPAHSFFDGTFAKSVSESRDRHLQTTMVWRPVHAGIADLMDLAVTIFR